MGKEKKKAITFPEQIEQLKDILQAKKQMQRGYDLQNRAAAFKLSAKECLKLGETLSMQGQEMIELGKNQAANLKSDIWALGIILYAMRTRAFPHFF